VHVRYPFKGKRKQVVKRKRKFLARFHRSTGGEGGTSHLTEIPLSG